MNNSTTTLPTLDEIRARADANVEYRRDAARKAANDKWFAWRKRVAMRLPELTARVFALRGINPRQRELERILAVVFDGVTDNRRRFTKCADGVAEQILLEIFVADLHKDLKAVETEHSK